ncbi:uncharacterized protein LOC117575456 [Drosophila albomicans]|uniref:Uncharacterized protein LOC117575456 n=1 Tax=Drosophila albomicans TaxID=7291 RepID=A0A6P8XR22_DROAB|nr:uncharacterized protein LOC117575456 [Drosophila albomicans]
MGNFSLAFAVLMLSTLAISQAAVYIGGGCYDCNPPGGQAPGVYSANGGGGGRGGGGNGGGRPVYSGNFGPNGYNGGGGGRGGGGGFGGGGNGGGYGGGGGGGYDDGGLTQIISG